MSALASRHVAAMPSYPSIGTESSTLAVSITPR
jgi:hypothetical protein